MSAAPADAAPPLDPPEAAEDLPLLSGDASAFVAAVPIAYARRHGVIAFAEEKEGDAERCGLRLSVSPETDPQAVDALRRFLPVVGQAVTRPAEEVARAVNDAYVKHAAERGGEATTAAVGRSREGAAEAAAGVEELIRRDDLLDSAGRAPVVQLVNALLFEAVQTRASDVHVQPGEEGTAVRFRIDGALFDAHRLPPGVHDELVSRVKVMGGMNIAEKRLPQDGRATVTVGDTPIDLRVSTVPTSFGERVVFRLLDKSARLFTLDELGMPRGVLEPFRGVINQEHGLILVTGPTGSGKSTTLYGVLQEIDAASLNVLTLEDPIEYQLPGISQMQVSEKKGMSFARGLRSVLRQDPDIVMVGEIRDKETADLAIQAALTGHLVFSTLHTNDAPSAVTRLLDLGVEPYLVASSVRAVLAQRLVRRKCGRCLVEPTDSQVEDDAAELGLDEEEAAVADLRRPAGCAACRHTGYRGRLGVFEYLQMDDAVRVKVQERAAASAIRSAREAQGHAGLRGDAVTKVLAGFTTTEEIRRLDGGEG